MHECARWPWVAVVALSFSVSAAEVVTGSAPQTASHVEPTSRSEVVSTRVPAAEASDAPPLSTLALVSSDGARVPVDGDAVAHAAFAGGVAVLRQSGALELYSASGVRWRVIDDSATPPVAAPNGDLLYGVQKGAATELRCLSRSGRDVALATGLGALGPLSPRADGRVLFIAAPPGGVAGLWLSDGARARCATNCRLRTHERWVGHLDLPFDLDAVRVDGERLRWLDAEGKAVEVTLAGGAR